MSFSLFSRQHNRQRRRTLTGCWWWGSFYWPSAWASPVSSWPSSFSSSQNRKIFRCYGSSSQIFYCIFFHHVCNLFLNNILCSTFALHQVSEETKSCHSNGIWWVWNIWNISGLFFVVIFFVGQIQSRRMQAQWS